MSHQEFIEQTVAGISSCISNIYMWQRCHQTSNISHTSVGYKIVDHSDVDGSYCRQLLQLHLHSRLYTWLQYIAQWQLQDEMRNISVLGFDVPYIRDFTIHQLYFWQKCPCCYQNGCYMWSTDYDTEENCMLKNNFFIDRLHARFIWRLHCYKQIMEPP